MGEHLANTKSNETFWIDVLRVIAAFAVIVIHTSGPFVHQYGQMDEGAWDVAIFYDSMCRFAVPVFVMITGTLLLSSTLGSSESLKKRVPRLVWPFLFYSILYLLYENGLKLAGGWRPDALLLVKSFLLPLYEGTVCYHLWYVYMILGLYLLLPIVAAWLESCTQKEVQFYVLIFIGASFLPFLPVHPLPSLFSVFSGYLGYAMLGYYLRKYPFQNTLQLGIWAFILYLLALSVTFWGTYFLTERNQSYKPALFHGYLVANDVAMSVAVFLIVKSHGSRLLKFKSAVMEVSQKTYGIYLVHPLLLFILGFVGIGVQRFPTSTIPLYAIGVMLASYLVVKVLSLIPFLKRFAT